MKTKFHLLCLLSALAVFSAGAQTTELYVTSSASGNILQGQTVLATPGEGFTFTAQLNNSDGVTVDIDGPNYPNDPWYVLEISRGVGGLLSPGTYTGADLFGTGIPETPGLSFSGNGNSDTSLQGSFTVDAVTIGAGETVTSLAVDFFQYDNGQSDAWEEGSLRFNSTVPVPEPSSGGLLMAAGLVAIVFFGRARNKIFPTA